MLGLFASFSQPVPDRLARLTAGEPLRVVMRSNVVSYVDGPRGPSGFEVSLVERFAASIGAEVEYVVADSPATAMDSVLNGDADIAATGIGVTPRQTARLRTGPSYQQVTEQVVSREDDAAPQSLDDLGGCELVVAAGSSHVETLGRLGPLHPSLRWRELSGADTDDLLDGVASGRYGCTVADSNEALLARRFLPQLSVDFDLGVQRALAWLLPQRSDDALYLAVSRFFHRLRSSDGLAELIEHHYGNAERFDYVSAYRLRRHTEQRLPPLLAMFREAGEKFDVDWRLLAAIGYQESHWNTQAVSPTGVRGIMMLTEATATQLGVEDRLDPEQSILGGARYLLRVKAKIPARIAEPDRTWFALAAYNIGYGHLEDARVLTQRAGADPDSWRDVRDHLPLLAEPEWYAKTRHGYARGREPVDYVDNVRHYYDFLLWLADHDDGEVHLRPRDHEELSAREASGLVAQSRSWEPAVP